ncbi:oxidoreductase [Allonocardiopsis opalescens]|uniref:Putative dehydrogenase n=1 Tax=Allonocardiopsis opalescens TaxID=1144618 RepID=A0A2T0QEQ4_9ACTN|nr:oxidoreductase [Allonocardiopsis opalescens]PRY02375.1 putative dehydrogenase [Allonocardiopsis opalescens]
MLHSFVVGLGRSGAGLHLPSLAKARAAEPHLFAPGPVLGHDPLRPPTAAPGLLAAYSLEEAARRLPPHRTVVHLCTPPHLRAGLLARLGGLGYRMVIVEKPLALDLVGLAAVARVRRRFGLDLTVTTQWLESALTRRLRAAVDGRAHGPLRAIRVAQHKPRFTRGGAGTDRHPTAFDVELPHALAVVLTLAGGARLAAAALDDLVTDRARLPRLGGARLRLHHRSGVRTELHSDLGSPVRERRIVLEFDRAVLTGHYPCSDADHTAQLRIDAEGREPVRSVFPDDSLPAFVRAAYARYLHAPLTPGTLPVQVDVVRLLTEAKALCASPPTGAERREEVAGAR